MTVINISNAQTYIDVHGASRRLRLSARNVDARLNDIMLPVLIRISKMKSGLEFHLFADNQFHVFMHGDYMGRFRMFEDKFVISSHNIKRERSAYGLGNNEECSSSDRTIVSKMAENWTHLTYEQIRGMGEYFCNRAYGHGQPNYEHNKVDGQQVSNAMGNWVSHLYHLKYLMTNAYGGVEPQDLAWNLMYQLFLDSVPTKQDLDWDEEAPKKSILSVMAGSISAEDKDKFIKIVDDMQERLQRKNRIKNSGVFARVNRDGKINLLLRKGPAIKAHPPRYNNLDGLFGHFQSSTGFIDDLYKEKFVNGFSAMVAAGQFRYVAGIGMRLTELPDQIALRDEADQLIGATMYWLEDEFVKPLTTGITIN